MYLDYELHGATATASSQLRRRDEIFGSGFGPSLFLCPAYNRPPSRHYCSALFSVQFVLLVFDGISEIENGPHQRCDNSGDLSGIAQVIQPFADALLVLRIFRAWSFKKIQYPDQEMSNRRQIR